MWIDSHCHLNHKKIRDLGSPEQIINEAKEAGIDGMLTICCRISDEFQEVDAIASAHENVWCTVGTHPHESGKGEELAISREEIVEKTRAPHVIGIGETGLDYYYDFSPIDKQKDCFIKHIEACLETELPVIIHTRDADEDTGQILEDVGQGQLKGVLHCFSSGRALAEKGLELGLYVSFSGIVTFKQAQDLQEIAKDIPLERILVETDAPYLAPVPYRGKTNHPKHVQETGKFLAELKCISQEDVASHSKENFFKLFSKAELE